MPSPSGNVRVTRDIEHFGEAYQPFVSVIVPAFNEERVIVRTIESLLASDYENFEVIVVDDGSTDDTYSAASERFAGERRVTLFTKENGGKAEALNFGLAACKWRHYRRA